MSGNEILLVLDGLDVENVSTGNKHARFGGCKDDGLDVCIRFNLRFFHRILGFVLDGKTDRVHRLGRVEANDRDAVLFDFDILKVLILAIRRRRELERDSRWGCG